VLMKRKALALILILVLLISVVAGTWFVNLAKADPIPAPVNPVPVISILSPEYNKTYAVNSVSLTFIVNLSSWGSYPFTLSPIEYYIDGKKQGQFAGNYSSDPFSVTLTGLSDGVHSVEVNVTTTGLHYNIIRYFQGYPVFNLVNDSIISSSGPIYFTIDTFSLQLARTLIIAASVASIAIIGVGLLVYFKKRKR
jgi:hypothetical protein